MNQPQTIGISDELRAYGLALRAEGLVGLAHVLTLVWSNRIAALSFGLRARFCRLIVRWYAMQVTLLSPLGVTCMAPLGDTTLRAWYSLPRIVARDNEYARLCRRYRTYRGRLTLHARLVAIAWFGLADAPTAFGLVWLLDCTLGLALFAVTGGLYRPLGRLTGAVLGFLARVVWLLVTDRPALTRDCGRASRAVRNYRDRWRQHWAMRPRFGQDAPPVAHSWLSELRPTDVSTPRLN